MALVMPNQPSFEQQFENLHGVGGGAFAQLIAGAPQHEVPVRMLVLAAQPRDVHEIRAFDVARRDDAVGA